jgi:membrane-bound ClpP family serine protease
MTQQDLGQRLTLGTAEDAEDSDALATLFDSSPARSVQTSSAAAIGFVLGLLGALAVPFSLTMALSGGLAAVALVLSIVGLARASRPGVAGGLLASVGLVLSLASLALVGLRYLGLDTAFGDSSVPTLHDVLDWLNGLLPPT